MKRSGIRDAWGYTNLRIPQSSIQGALLNS